MKKLENRFTAETKELKSSQAKIKNAVTQRQTWTDAMTMEMDEAEERITDTED